MRIWTEMVAPKFLHDNYGVYKGIWMPQMDRCWKSDDGYTVMSRIIRTDWGKVEHATISRMEGFTNKGESDIPWKVKQEIKNELFGETRIAIEVFPTEKNKVDILDIYHLWVFEKGFKLPFGIHPKDAQGSPINRGCIPFLHDYEGAFERMVKGER